MEIVVKRGRLLQDGAGKPHVGITRTQELCLRLALGVGGRQMSGLVVGDSLKLATAGLALGLAGSIAVGRAIGGMLFVVPRTDVFFFFKQKTAYEIHS